MQIMCDCICRKYNVPINSNCIRIKIKIKNLILTSKTRDTRLKNTI